jgi:hypothetical protein
MSNLKSEMEKLIYSKIKFQIEEKHNQNELQKELSIKGKLTE